MQWSQECCPWAATSWSTSGGNLPLPFDLLAHFPAIDNILPIRFAFTTGACVAAVIAFGLDGLRARSRCPLGAPPRQHSPALTTACAFTVVALVLVLTWLPTWPYPTQAVMTLPAGVTKALPTENPIVLAYPYPVAPEDQAYLWQAVARFSFRLLGVYGRVPGRVPVHSILAVTQAPGPTGVFGR